MTEKMQIRIDCLSEILKEVGVIVTEEQISQIAEDFNYHIEIESEIESHRYFGNNKGFVICEKCKQLEEKLKDAENTIRIYRKNVCERRSTTDVWIDKSNETIMYRHR